MGGVRVATFISNAGKRVIVQSAGREGFPVPDCCLFLNTVLAKRCAGLVLAIPSDGA